MLLNPAIVRRNRKLFHEHSQSARLRLSHHQSFDITRSYSAKPPVYKNTSNILINALNYVKDVEDYQNELLKSSSDAVLAKELLLRICEQPELLFLLLRFHSQLAKIGITPSSSRDFTMAQVWRYRFNYVTRLSQLHEIFWTQCRYLNISERQHNLGFLPNKIGILDPKNFELELYNDIQHGIYNGVSFRNMTMLGFRNDNRDSNSS